MSTQKRFTIGGFHAPYSLAEIQDTPEVIAAIDNLAIGESWDDGNGSETVTRIADAVEVANAQQTYWTFVWSNESGVVLVECVIVARDDENSQGVLIEWGIGRGWVNANHLHNSEADAISHILSTKRKRNA